jgi:hypothetical protein
VIDIKLTQGLVVALSCILMAVVLLAYLALTEQGARASGENVSRRTSLAQSSGMRQFYLTIPGHPGGTAKTACAAGYHMASLWEIADPSNLRYNIALGFAQADSGGGPPADEAYMLGWVRTGYVSDHSSTPGRANCNGWTVGSYGIYGTTASLPSQWTADLQDIGVWQLAVQYCSDYYRVWCIED